MLPREEYIEQAYFFRIIGERIVESMPLQELMEQTRHEVLATAKLPMAIDYMLTELKHSGVMAPAMRRMIHYFAPFQAYLIDEAERESGRFDMRVALAILHAEAQYRGEMESRQGFFLFQFETLCRNRLRYDAGIGAMVDDPVYNDAWREWLRMLRMQVGILDLADMIYLASTEYSRRAEAAGEQPLPEEKQLFGIKEGRIALANRRKDPLYLFAAMQRHLGYPPVPRPKPPDETKHQIPRLMRRMESLELRIKLIEEEQRQGIDITKFYQQTQRNQPPPAP